MRILHVSSECAPFVKTGGLADAVAGLAKALAARGHEVRVLLPAYRGALPQQARELQRFALRCTETLYQARLWEAALEEPSSEADPPWRVRRNRRSGDQPSADRQAEVRFWFLDIPELFDRDGGPYLAPDGREWWDNGERFAALARAAAHLALGDWAVHGIGWRADVVHAHDWQAGLVAAYLRHLASSSSKSLPRLIFSIHNAAFQGWFPEDFYDALGLPRSWWHMDGVEAWGQLNMLKAGAVLSDYVTTVSPTYARELQAYAYGLEGVLRRLAAENRFLGITNGIDIAAWDPASDPVLAARLCPGRGFAAAKRRNRAALLAELASRSSEALSPGADRGSESPVVGFVGRLTEQKGIDWLIEAIAQLLASTRLGWVVLGSGEKRFEQALSELAAAYPQRVWVRIGYDERLARRIYAGSDLFVMPSRFEPCGLAQIYAMRYGSVPVARAVGGLNDTIRDIATGRSANGFLYHGEARELVAALQRAYHLWCNHPRRWGMLVRQGMQEDFSWEARLPAYLALYGEHA